MTEVVPTDNPKKGGGERKSRNIVPGRGDD